MNLSVILFLILDIISVLIIFVIFFIIKEYSRIKHNDFTIFSLIVAFVILFPIVFIFEYFFAYYNKLIYLSLIPLLLIFLSIYIDSKFSYIIFFIFLIGWISKTANLSDEFDPIYLLPLIANFSLLLIINLIKFDVFPIKEEYFLSLSMTFIYVILLFFFALIFYAFLDSSYLFYDSAASTFLVLLIIYFSFYYIFYIFIFFSLILVEYFYQNFYKLENFSKQDEVSYFKVSLAKDYLKKYIVKNNYKYGFLVLFDIDSEFRITHNINFILTHLKEMILDEYKNAFFLKVDSKYYSVFIPFKQNEVDLELIYKNNNAKVRENDFLSKLENILNSININQNKIEGFATLYGIDSHDFNQLIYNATYLFNQTIREKNYYNTINVYDFRRIKNRLIRNNQSYYLLNQIKEYEINYVRANTNQKIYYPIIFVKTDKSSKRVNLYEFLEKNSFTINEKIIIERYFALRILKDFHNYNYEKLVLNYPINYFLHREFSIKKFLEHINVENVDSEKLIIGLFAKDIKRISEKGMNVLNSLSEHGIDFAILDLEYLNTEIYEMIKPSWFKYQKEHSILKFFQVQKPLTQKEKRIYHIDNNLLN